MKKLSFITFQEPYMHGAAFAKIGGGLSYNVWELAMGTWSYCLRHEDEEENRWYCPDKGVTSKEEAIKKCQEHYENN